MGACSPRLAVFSESQTSSQVYPEIRPINVPYDTVICIVDQGVADLQKGILTEEKSKVFRSTSGKVFSPSPSQHNSAHNVKTPHHIDQPSPPKLTYTHRNAKISTSQIHTKPTLSISDGIENISSNNITPVKKDFKNNTSDITTSPVESYLYQADTLTTKPMITLSSSPYPDPTNIFLGMIIGGVILISAIVIGFILRWKHRRDHSQTLSIEDVRNIAAEKIQAGELEEAFSTLLDNHLNTYYKQRILVLQTEYFAGKQGYRYNELSPDEYFQVKNTVTLGLLDLLEDMDHHIRFSHT